MSEDLKVKVYNTLQVLHDKGIPIPMLQDQSSKTPSASFSLLILSALILVLSVFHVDHLAFEECKEFFTICAGLYFLRRVTDGGKNLLGKSDSAEDKNS